MTKKFWNYVANLIYSMGMIYAAFLVCSFLGNTFGVDLTRFQVWIVILGIIVASCYARRGYTGFCTKMDFFYDDYHHRR